MKPESNAVAPFGIEVSFGFCALAALVETECTVAPPLTHCTVSPTFIGDFSRRVERLLVSHLDHDGTARGLGRIGQQRERSSDRERGGNDCDANE